MKKKVMYYIISSLICTVVFLSFSVTFLQSSIKSESAANKQNEPYIIKPENKGILFELPNKKGCFVYLDFKAGKTFFTFCENVSGNTVRNFPVDYRVLAKPTLFAGIIDRTGGVELDISGENMRYTGEQISDIINTAAEDTQLKYKVVRAVFNNISKNGFSKNDFVFIIENSETNLLVPDCLSWQEHIAETVSNIEVIS